VPPASRGPIHSRRATSPSMEQYIEAIAHLLTQDTVCSISDIAAEVEVSRPAASRAVRDLAAKELVDHKSYGYVNLTPAGHALAEKLNARHKALFEFLSEVLQFNVELADQEACRLEHQMDDATVYRMAQLTDLMRADPLVAKKWEKRLRGFIENHDTEE